MFLLLLLAAGVLGGIALALVRGPIRTQNLRKLAHQLGYTYHESSNPPANARQSLEMLRTGGGAPESVHVLEGEHKGRPIHVFDYGQSGEGDGPSNLGTIALMQYSEELPTCRPTHVEGHDPRTDLAFDIQFESQGHWLAIRPVVPNSAKPRRAAPNEVKALIHMLPPIARDLARTNQPH